MTDEPPLSAEKVAELEHQLANAAAEVARVQAQLEQAKHAGDPPPPVGPPVGTTPPPGPGAPGTTIPAVPYAGSDPHLITINGQPVTAGSGDLAAMLRQYLPAAGGGAPVVVVNGQPVSGGQPVDLSAYLTPEVTQQLQSSLQQLGLDGQLGALFGQVGAPPPSGPVSAAPLAEPPRHVPGVLKLSVFAWSWWELFCLIIGVTAPIAVFIFVPAAFSVWLVLAVLVIGWFRLRRYRRLGLLKHGKVATVTATQVQSTGTYYSGLTYQNMRVPQARGWQVTRAFYSGPATTTKIDYSVDGAPGSLLLRGLPYAQGVVLADPRKPERAEVVSAFPFSMAPGPDGQLVGELSAWAWLGVISTLLIESMLVALTVFVVVETWFG